MNEVDPKTSAVNEYERRARLSKKSDSFFMFSYFVMFWR